MCLNVHVQSQDVSMGTMQKVVSYQKKGGIKSVCWTSGVSRFWLAPFWKEGVLLGREE